MFDCVQNKTKQAITLTATESQLHCHMVVNISELFGLVELIWSIELLSTRFFRKLCLVQHFTFCLFSFLYFNGLLSPFIKCIHLDVWVFWIRHSHSFTRYGIRNEWEKKKRKQQQYCDLVLTYLCGASTISSHVNWWIYWIARFTRYHCLTKKLFR